MKEINKRLVDVVVDTNLKANSSSIREDGVTTIKNGDLSVSITKKTDKAGTNVFAKENSKDKIVTMPVVMSNDMNDTVYTDIVISNNCSVKVFAGCGVYSNCSTQSKHYGIHNFKIGQNSTFKYIENHYAEGTCLNKIIDTITIVEVGENSTFEMMTRQIGGVTSSKKVTTIILNNNSTAIVNEKIFTSKKDLAKTTFNIKLNGKNSKATISSRSVADEKSKQHFISNVVGNNSCFAHVECDAIILKSSNVSSTPKITAKNKDSILIHEAAIGKISEDQQNKLMSLGLSKEEAEKTIIDGFLN